MQGGQRAAAADGVDVPERPSTAQAENTNNWGKSSTAATARKLAFYDALSVSTDLTPQDKVIAWRLLHYYDAERGYAWPSIMKLAQEANCSERTAQYCVRHLIQAGWYKLVPGAGGGRHQTNRYVPCLEKVQIAAKNGATNCAVSPDDGVQNSAGNGAAHCTQPLYVTSLEESLSLAGEAIPYDWQPSKDDLDWAAQTRPDIDDLPKFTAKFIAKLNAAGGTTGPIWAKWRQWLTTETAPRRRPQTAQPRRAPQHQTGHQRPQAQQHPIPSHQPLSATTSATAIIPSNDTHTTANTVEARNAAKCQAVLDILNARLNTSTTIEIVQDDQEPPHHVH